MIAALAAALLAAAPPVDAGSADAGVSPAPPKAVLLMSTNPDLFEKWASTKPSERAAIKGLQDKVKINERTLIAVALDGYELPRSRKVELTADLVIVDSTGRTVLEKASVANTRIFDPKLQTAALLKPISSLIYGVTDPEGVYTARITVWDQIRGVSSKAEVQFTVTR